MDYNTPYSAADPQTNVHVDHATYDQRAHPYPPENGYAGSDPSLTSSTSSRDRKGKGKARESDQPHSYTVHAPSSWDSRIAEAEANQPSVSVPGPSIAIIPGAPPDKRFKPARSVPDEQYYSQGHVAHWSEEPAQVVRQAHWSEEPAQVVHPAHWSEEPTQVVHPAHWSEEPTQVVHPAHWSEEPAQVVHPAHWGEEPTQVVHRPPPSWLQPSNGRSESRTTIDPYPLVEEYIMNGYANGFSSGYHMATGRDSMNPLSESSQSRPRSSRTKPPAPTLPTAAFAPANSGFRERSPSRTMVAQQQAAVPMTAPLPPSSTVPAMQSIQRTSSMTYRPIDSTPPSIPLPFNSALGLIPSPSSNPTPASAPSRASRRRATQPVGAITTTESPAATYVPSSATGRQTGSRRQSTGILSQPSSPHNVVGNRVSLASFSSWGTVNSSNPVSPSRLPITEDMLFQRPDEIRSVSDLRLHSFGDDDVGGQRASVAYSIESLATGVEAVQLIPEDNLPRQLSQEAWGERNRDNATPRAQTQTTARPQNRRHRHGAYPASLSQTAPPPPMDHATPADASSGRSSRPQSQVPPTSSRSRQHRRHESSSRRQEPISSEVIVEDLEYAGAGDAPPVNALGLSDIFEISAPTPRIPSGPYVRSWGEESWLQR